MLQIKDLSTAAIAECLQCSATFATFIKHRQRKIPKRKIESFAQRFGFTIEQIEQHNAGVIYDS